LREFRVSAAFAALAAFVFVVSAIGLLSQHGL
jgi:hypothetical protein